MEKDLFIALKDRVLVLDGAMGTMIQKSGLSDKDFNGDLFAYEDYGSLKGCNDVLCLTQPDAIKRIHKAYIDAGADIIETNSFNANAISLRDYHLENHVEEINLAAARLAREAVDEYASLHQVGRRVFVAGSMGPSNFSLSISDSGEVRVDWDIMEKTYYDQAKALIKGGVDIILLETIFDTLNAKAAIHGIRRAMRETGRTKPLIISVTLTETGRTLSGQDLDAFLASIEHSGAICVGLNCGFGPQGMLKPLKELSEKAGCFVSAYPNAGLPDEMGCYTETPERMATGVERMLKEGLVNIIGGCCGTTPEHIKEISRIAASAAPRIPVTKKEHLVVSGLKGLDIDTTKDFIKIGERCNVAGSRKFLRLINEGNTTEALDIAAAQIEKGAQVLDINMDDGLLDPVARMTEFVRLLSMDVRTASVPVMIDSSDFNVITSALKILQGRAIVNSISLKNGEEDFLDKARIIKELGGSVVVMAFDENGQADTFERRKSVCDRAYKLLVGKAGYRGCDIIFDPNILAVATGIREHDNYALDFLKTLKWIKENLPGAKVSGGVSNLSFSFRGNDPVRKAMHARFLELGIANGLDMAIVNPTTHVDSKAIDEHLLELIDDVLFNRKEGATDALVSLAMEIKAEADRRKLNGVKPSSGKPDSFKNKTSSETIAEKIVSGNPEGMEPLLSSALQELGSSMRVINECLMEGMNKVGYLFGEGKMFLPQVVRSASVMEKAVEWLSPHIEKENQTCEHNIKSPLMVLATVKGDVHDIGKNIVAIVMRCSGFEVMDLGVMAEASDIVETAISKKADFIGLSGLITPSLHEMAEVARLMDKKGLRIPLFVGGATTSDLHTAVKIAPCYAGPVIHTADAAALSIVASRISDTDYLEEIKERSRKLRDDYENKRKTVSLAAARELSDSVNSPSPDPKRAGIHDLMICKEDILPLINWKAFLHEWGLKTNGNSETEEENNRVIEEAKEALGSFTGKLYARIALLPASRRGDDIVISTNDGEVVLPMIRSQLPNPVDGRCRSLADYINVEDDHIGLFAVTTAGSGLPETIEALSAERKDYQSLMWQILSHRLVEAATEFMHSVVRKDYWGIQPDCGIRPAIGYSSLPDQSLMFELDRILHYSTIGVELTSNGALYPSATTSGLIFGNPEARYFEAPIIDEDQREVYGRRRGMDKDMLNRFLL